ncbi:hypothetical protein QJQ45_023839 [Haematococcus lacustris]|nr:hypothetical protein QJQ45_023839 [Haematococcus lacustris]
MVAPSDAWVDRPLFGGAMLLPLPARMTDIRSAALGCRNLCHSPMPSYDVVAVSRGDIRPVPDHQEVWADPHCDQSLVVEVVEYASAVQCDQECGRYYFEDQACQNDSSSSALQAITRLGAADVPLVPSDKCAAVLLASGSQMVTKGGIGAGSMTVDVQVLVLRLPAVAADVLLVLNTPVAEQAAASAGQEPSELLRSAALGLQIKDWGLFGPG